MKNLGTICLFCLLSFSSMAQKTILNGFVQDARTKEKIIGATVFNRTNGQWNTTNDLGYYNIVLESGIENEIVVSFIGYRKSTFSKIPDGNDFKIFNLQIETLDEVIVIGDRERDPTRTSEMGVINIQMAQLAKIPALGGEKDVLKGLQLLPGVQQGQEGSSGLYVRGGSIDQNLFLLDDVALYDVNHLGGFISTFNPDALNNVKLYKGGFPARYANRLSSVVDIRLKNGNKTKREGKFSIGMLSAKAHLEGPIIKDTLSYLVSYRRMLYDLIARPIFLLTSEYSLGYHFQDFNAKINYQPTDRHGLSLFAYAGNDRLSSRIKGDKSRSSLDWGNRMAGFKWEWILGKSSLLNTTVSYSNFANKIKNRTRDESFSFSSRFRSQLYDLTIKSIYENRLGPRYNLIAGFSATSRSFEPYSLKVESDDQNEHIERFSSNTKEGTLFIENHIDIGTRLNMNLGFNTLFYRAQGDNFILPQLRAMLNYQVGDFFSIKASYGQMAQSLHFLVGEGYSDLFNTDYWLPANSFAEPETSWIGSLGVAGVDPLGRFSYTIEAYYKEMDGLINYKPGELLSDNTPSWENVIEKDGNGKAYGLELFLKKKSGKTTGWLGYTLSYTDRQFDNINTGERFPFKYDRRHSVNLVAFHKIRKNIELSATWVFNSGEALTLPTSKYLADIPQDYERPVYTYPAKNSQRLKDYHRLDMGISFSKQKKKGVRTWNISLYNVYNRLNVFEYQVDDTTEVPTYFEYTLFPFLPSIAYEYQF